MARSMRLRFKGTEASKADVDEAGEEPEGELVTVGSPAGRSSA